MRYLLVVFLSAAFASATYAGTFRDGNWLYDQCNPNPSIACYAYLMAAAEALDRGNGIAKPEFNICLPDKTAAQQLRDVAVNELFGSPQRRTDPAFYIVAQGFMKAWPCVGQ